MLQAHIYRRELQEQGSCQSLLTSKSSSFTLETSEKKSCGTANLMVPEESDETDREPSHIQAEDNSKDSEQPLAPSGSEESLKPKIPGPRWPAVLKTMQDKGIDSTFLPDDEVEDRWKRAQNLIPLRMRTALAHQEKLTATEELNTLKQDADAAVLSLEVLIEEVRLQMASTKRDSYEFRRDAVIGGALASRAGLRAQRVSSDRAVRHVEEKIRTLTTQRDKLCSKNQALRAQLTRAEAQLKQKIQQGETLRPIDLQQLKIENKQLDAELAARNHALTQAKLAAGHVLHALNDARAELNEAQVDVDRLAHDLVEYRKMSEKLKNDARKVEQEFKKEKERFESINQSAPTGETPQIIHYITLRERERKLVCQREVWKRRIELTKKELPKFKHTIEKARLLGILPAKSPTA
ncbi:MAG: hypothetical protein MHM6MM_003982 [Cercozoa sp. M6MM]